MRGHRGPLLAAISTTRLCVIAPIVLEASGDSPSAHIVTEEEAHSSPLPLLPLMLQWGLNGKGTERRKAKIPQLPR